MKSRAVLGARPAQTRLQSFHASLRKLLNTVVREFHITEDYFGTNAWTDSVNISVEVNTKNAKLKSLMKEQTYQMLLDVGRGKQNVKNYHFERNCYWELKFIKYNYKNVNKQLG